MITRREPRRQDQSKKIRLGEEMTLLPQHTLALLSLASEDAGLEVPRLKERVGASTLLLGTEEEGGCVTRRFHLDSPLDTEPLAASDGVGVSRVGSLPAGGAAVGVTVAGDVHLTRGIVR